MSDSEEEYEVEKILDRRWRRRGKKQVEEFLVRWKNFGPDEDTWEPKENLEDCEVLTEFEESFLESTGSETELVPTPMGQPPIYYKSALEESASKTLEAAEIITRRRLQVDQQQRGRNETEYSLKSIPVGDGEAIPRRPFQLVYVLAIVGAVILLAALGVLIYWGDNVLLSKSMWSRA